MRITCPVCTATYDVPDQMLRSGRKVRCGRCSEQWVATAAPAGPPEALAPVAPPPSPAPDQTVAAARVPRAPPSPPPAPPPTEMPAAVASAAPPSRAAAEPEPSPAAARHPLLAVVGAEPPPRAPAPTPPSPPVSTIARERPPPSVWDRLTDTSEPSKPLVVSEPLQPGRGGVAAMYDQPPAPRRAGAAVWLGWILSLVIWGLVAWAAYAYRYQLMDAWPPIRRLYSAFGIGP